MPSNAVAADSPRRDFLSALTSRLLDTTKTRDYLVAGVVAAGPSIAAWMAGNHVNHVGSHAVNGVPTDVTFFGFWQRPNWYTHVIDLPVALFLFRWAMARIAPVASPELPDNPPGVLELVSSPEGRVTAYRAMRDALLRPSNLAIALLFAVVFTLVDVAPVIRMYIDPAGPWPAEADWTWVFVTGKVNEWANLAQVAYAYLVQGAILTLPALFLVIMVRHNFFFLGRVYQRRRVSPDAKDAYIVIDLDDPDECFGFRRADTAFNTQVSCLWIAGIGLMASRIVNVSGQSELLAYELLHRVVPSLAPAGHIEPALSGLFPDFGQWVLVVGWLVGLAIVSLPALVKFLPRLPFTGAGREQATLTGYLREFLPDSYWPFSDDPSGPEVNALAAHFAANAFWPTGNNRAKYQFTLAAFWGLALAFPVFPRRNNVGVFALAFVILCLLAYLLTWMALKALETQLVVVDRRLVGAAVEGAGSASPVRLPNGAGPPTLLLGDRFDRRIFISYRHDEAAAWARLLRDALEESCYPDRIFRDIEQIPPGEKFGEVIEAALTEVDVAIVLIGPRWLDERNADGGRRLDDPQDWVRIEITRALARSDVLVVPALLGGARMPALADLPEPLKPLAQINAIELSDSRWDFDVRRLVDAMRTAFRATQREHRRPHA